MTKIDQFHYVREKFELIVGEIRIAAKKEDLDPCMMAAICWQESHFDPNARRFEQRFYEKFIRPLKKSVIKTKNPAVASAVTIQAERMNLATSWGLMQVLGNTARELGYQGAFLGDLCHPEIGLRYGAKYLKKQLNRYGEMERALSAYNAGSETEKNLHTYVEPVLERYLILHTANEVRQWFL